MDDLLMCLDDGHSWQHCIVTFAPQWYEAATKAIALKFPEKVEKKELNKEVKEKAKAIPKPKG